MARDNDMEPTPTAPTRQVAFDYDRTVIAFHGTTKEAAESLVSGTAFGPSQNDDDWLGHGIYFWEYAPQQAWWWAERRHGEEGAVVGALVRLGRCIDLLDPSNVALLEAAHRELALQLASALPKNANTQNSSIVWSSTISSPSSGCRSSKSRALGRCSSP